MAALEFVLDTPLVRNFVADVAEAVAASSAPEQACEAIRPRFAALLADADWLPPEYQAPAPASGMGGGIGQWLLCRAEDGSLSLFSLVVPAGAQTPVHDHLAWGLVGLYRGTQEEEVFAKDEGGLELVERRALVPGDFYALLPPRDDIHSVRTTSAEASVRSTCSRTTPAACGGTRTTPRRAPRRRSARATSTSPATTVDARRAHASTGDPLTLSM